MALSAPSVTPRRLSVGLYGLTVVLAAAGVVLAAGALRAPAPGAPPGASLDLAAVAPAGPAPQPVSAQDYQALAGLAVFGVPAAHAPPAAAPQQPADTTVHATVVGVIVRGDLSRAIVDVGTVGQRLLAVGDSLEGGRITAITLTEVVLERDGRQITLPVRATGRRPAPAPQPATAAPRAIALGPAGPAPQEYDEGGIDTGDIDLKDFDAFYGDLKKGFLEAQAKTAHDANGKAVGLDFDAVPERALLWRMGLRPGDIVTAVNDIDVTDMNGLLNAFDKVAAQVRQEDESFIVIDLVRNQKPDAVILTIW